MVEMWYGSILQLRAQILWAVEMKAKGVFKKIRAGNKPGSVLTDVSRDHSSGTAVTDSLSVLPNRQAGSLIAVLFGLATGGVYTASPVTRTAVGFYPPFHPYLCFLRNHRRYVFCCTIHWLAPSGR
ncbi:MAG: hypothetical protein Ct9H300mP28_03070 [Pseudomonadota bacterium]|nr:MAG: hypothetical protein Ct9H300mP28_03070 [Pseudomonadota bacterium]